MYLKPGVGAIKLQELKPSHIQTLYGQLLERPLAPSTVHYAGSILKTALKYATDVEQLIVTNAGTKVQTPKGSSVTPDLWSLDELRTFLKVASEHRLGFYFRLSAYTGARRGELCALRWTDFDGSLLTISKNRVKAGRQVLELN
jgi:integrase